MGLSGTKFPLNKYGINTGRAPIDGAVQKLVQRSMRQRELYLTYYPPLVSRPGQGRVYDTMRRDYHYRNKAQGEYLTVGDYHSFARNGTMLKRKFHLKLFPASGPLGFVAVDILEPSPKNSEEKQYVLVITDRYSKPTRAVPTAYLTTTSVACILLHDWIILYRMPMYFSTDNNTQFTSKFFATFYTHLATKQLRTTAYTPPQQSDMWKNTTERS